MTLTQMNHLYKTFVQENLPNIQLGYKGDNGRSYPKNEIPKMKEALCFWEFCQQELDSMLVSKNEKISFLQQHVNKDNPHLKIVAKLEMLPDLVFRKTLLRNRCDFVNKESFLRRLSQEQKNEIEENWDAIYLRKKIPPCFSTIRDTLRILFRIITYQKICEMSIQNENGNRYSSIRSIAFDWLYLGMGDCLYLDENKTDKKIQAGTWAEKFVSFFDSSNEKRFFINKDDGLYYFFYRFVRHEMWFRQFWSNDEIKLSRAICPPFWVTVATGSWFFFGPILSVLTASSLTAAWFMYAYLVIVFVLAAMTKVTIKKDGDFNILLIVGTLVACIFLPVIIGFLLSENITYLMSQALILPAALWCIAWILVAVALGCAKVLTVVTTTIFKSLDKMKQKYPLQTKFLFDIFVYAMSIIAFGALCYYYGVLIRYLWVRSNGYFFNVLFTINIAILLPIALATVLVLVNKKSKYKNSLLMKHKIALKIFIWTMACHAVNATVAHWSTIISFFNKVIVVTINWFMTNFYILFTVTAFAVVITVGVNFAYHMLDNKKRLMEHANKFMIATLLSTAWMLYQIFQNADMNKLDAPNTLLYVLYFGICTPIISFLIQLYNFKQKGLLEREDEVGQWWSVVHSRYGLSVFSNQMHSDIRRNSYLTKLSQTEFAYFLHCITKFIDHFEIFDSWQKRIILKMALNYEGDSNSLLRRIFFESNIGEYVNQKDNYPALIMWVIRKLLVDKMDEAEIYNLLTVPAPERASMTIGNLSPEDIELNTWYDGLIDKYLFPTAKLFEKRFIIPVKYAFLWCWDKILVPIGMIALGIGMISRRMTTECPMTEPEVNV